MSNLVFGTLPHRVHAKRRRAVNPFMSKRAITANESVIHERVAKLCDALERQAKHDGFVEFRVNYLAFATDVVFTFSYNGSLDLLGNPREAREWKNTIGAISGLTPLIKQFPWLIPMARRLPLIIWTVLLPDLARALLLHRASHLFLSLSFFNTWLPGVLQFALILAPPRTRKSVLPKL